MAQWGTQQHILPCSFQLRHLSRAGEVGRNTVRYAAGCPTAPFVIIATARIRQIDPIHVLGDLAATCDLEPGLAHVVSSESQRHAHRGARPERGYALVCSIVPLLPDSQTTGMSCISGATGSTGIVLLLPVEVTIGR